MRKKWKLTITIGSVLIVLLSSLIPLFLFYSTKPLPPVNHNFMYPNPLFENASFSDMSIESDDRVHFAMRSYKLRNISYGPTYGYLNMENQDNHSFTYEPLMPAAILMNHYQIRIVLNASSQPLIYYYYRDGWGYDRSTFFMKLDENWDFVPFYDNLTLILLNTGPMLDFCYLPSGELVYANIYQELRISYAIITPILYNEHTQEIHFLNNTFPEIMDSISFSPGDFCITNTSTIVFWTQYLAVDSYHPYLAVNWEDVGWQIYKIGNETNQFLARTIIPENEGFTSFYYDNGVKSNAAKLIMMKMYNSSYSTTETIANLTGRIYFHDDSIRALSQNCYIFLYSKKAYVIPSQNDLFLGIYNNSEFREIQLTNTSQQNEYWGHCEVGTNYLHYAWTRFDYDGTETFDWESSRIYYNRTSFDELEALSKIVSSSKSKAFTNPYYLKQPFLNFVLKSETKNVVFIYTIFVKLEIILYQRRKIYEFSCKNS